MKSKINSLLIVHFASIVMIFEGLFMLLPIGISMIYHEATMLHLILAFAVTFGGGLVLFWFTRKHQHGEPDRRESIVIVVIGWFILGFFGTLPYLFTHAIPHFTNAFFESISGFTTTGSSILADIESLPKSILFWRAETHWIGGMGIIVLVLAVMPFIQIRGIYLFYSEMSSVSDEKISTKIRRIARNLWLVYTGLTLIEILLLWMGKMSLFDSVCHSFATIATGGFSTKNDSIAGFSPYIQYIITLFMFLSGINFALHLLTIKGRIKKVLNNEEFRLYLFLIVFVTLAITLILYNQNYGSFENVFRQAIFQVVSILTATGFATADYLQWPAQAILLIGFLMLVGASSGSTGGGVKVIRHVISLKKIRESFRNLISPNTITVVRYNDEAIDQAYISEVMGFIIMYYFIIAVSTLTMMLSGLNPATSFGAVTTCMGGIGPGFGSVGPASNFFHLPVISKYFLTFLMVVGRLEIYSVLVIFMKWFWRD